MLQRTFGLRKVSRSWTKASISASTAHFPDAIRAVDPASLRNDTTTAKERLVFTLQDRTQSELPLPAKSKLISRLQREVTGYAQLVRLSAPTGWLLLLLPCYWGCGLAVSHALFWDGADAAALCAPLFPPQLVISFFAGAFLMRGAGCILNDLCDRKFDRMVARTASRPLAARTVSMTTAVTTFFVHIFTSLMILLSLSPAAVKATLAIVPLTLVYPLMKRYTYFPQVVLGLCFNWGIIVGYAAVLGRVDWAVCLPIYLAAVLWTMLYDTIYAYQDIEDDLKCGVKSMAIWVGDRKYILKFMVPIIGLGIAASGIAAAQALPFYVVLLMGVRYLGNIVNDVNIYDRWSCGLAFRANVKFGWLVLLAIVLGNAVWAYIAEHEHERDGEQNSVEPTSSLMQYLYLNKQRATVTECHHRMVDVDYIDRCLHPALVQAECAKARGETEPPPIPAWMRREYLVQNVSAILTFCGLPDDFVHRWAMKLYSILGDYNNSV